MAADPSTRGAFDGLARIAGLLLGGQPVTLDVATRPDPVTLGSAGFSLQSPPSLAPALVPHLLATGSPLVVHDARLDDALALLPAVRDSGFVAFLAVPITLADGTIAGDVCAMSPSPRAWTEADREALSEVAAAAAREIEHRISVRRQVLAPLPGARLINLLPVGLYACDGAGRVVFFNERAAAMWGHPPRIPAPEAETFAHRHLYRLDGERLADEALPGTTSLRDRSTATNREYLMGPGRTVLVSWGPSLSETDQLLGAVVVMQDVTDLRRATRLRDDLLALVSHELRTPLTVINGMAHVLERRLPQGADQDADVALEDIIAAGRRMERVVENMLLLSRLEHESTEPEPVLVTGAFSAALERHRRDFPASRVELQFHDRGLMVQAVPSWLSLILVNLLRNAEQYGDGSRPHVIQAIESGGAVDISLCNTGAPLNRSEYAGWFEPFYRATTTSATVAGAGLGLTVARRLAEAQGGAIAARPWPNHSGTIVTLTLPRPSEDL